MKHLKKLNEYQRTTGFRYSQPKERFDITIYLDGDLTQKQVEETLKEVDVVFKNVGFEEPPEDFDSENEVVSVVKFELNIYNEKELDKILEDFSNIINLDYNVRTLQFYAKPVRPSKKMNEAKKEFDVEFFKDVFQDFIDDGAESEWIDGTFFGISIKIPNIRSGLSGHGINKIRGYIESTKEIVEIMDDLEVAINRIKSEYENVISVKVQENGNDRRREKYWIMTITIEPEETFPF